MGYKKITVYTTSSCPYCMMAKRYLNDHSVEFVEKDVLQDEKTAREMAEKSGQLGVPVIIVEQSGREDIIVGFDKGRIDELLNLR